MTDRVHFSDLTAINVPFGLLDDDTQERLKECGGPWEWYDFHGWKNTSPNWIAPLTYRQSPGTPLVVHDWSMLADWVQYVARERVGVIIAFSVKPTLRETYRSTGQGKSSALLGYSPRLIDPGTCHWTKAIAKRPGND